MIITLLALAMLLPMVLLSGSPVRSAFTARTGSAGNALSAASDFEAGSLTTWGGTFAHTSTPVRVGVANGWTGIALGPASDCGVRDPGTLWCSGANAAGQLGLGDTTSRAAPTQVGATTNWASVRMGATHACATRGDGTLWCWGANDTGQVGDGTATQRLVPTQVTTPAATGWAQVAVGRSSSCAIRSDTSLWCWGANDSGGLGDGTTTARSIPTRVSSPSSTGWSSVSTGDTHTCATRTGGSLYCWGQGGAGQLGRGSTTASSTPVQVNGSDWSTVGTGRLTTCGVKAAGTLWCWGWNLEGEAGIGTMSNVLAPAQVGSASTWQKTALGQYHSCATRADGSLWCWGNNPNGQLGDGTATRRTAPVQVVAPSSNGWSLDGLGVGADRTCALRSGALWCWGNQYGDPTVAMPVDGASDWRRPSNGTDFSCALRAGALSCWGVNANGQLGDGTITARLGQPGRVGTGTDWTQVSAGFVHACAIRADSTLWCWGKNADGQLGIGSTVQQLSPAQVTVPSSTGWASVSTSFDFTCATRVDSSAYCWGKNAFGQLGIGSTTSQTVPTQITAPAAGWSSVSAGLNFACGLRGTSVSCWGGGADGRLGTGSTTSQTAPAAVSGTFQTVSSGGSHACAIDTDGGLWCWGWNSQGQLGIGSTTSASSPTRVGTGTTWRSVSAGWTFTCGTRTGPSSWCWGANNNGQLGLGDTVDRTSPAQLPKAGRPVVAGSMSFTGTLVSRLP